jgi:Mrp family chromosome partitioning ATPase
MKQSDSDSTENSTPSDQGDRPRENNTLVRLLKPIVINPERGKRIDDSIVSSRYYNCFNYSLVSKDNSNVHLAVGVTSANRGDGKTLVASNLAVSLAIANQRETVLVDLNVRSPQLHSIFGTKLNPGLVEAMNDRSITVSQTQIKHLYVLSAGTMAGGPVLAERLASGERMAAGGGARTSLNLEHVAAFRDVLYSLKEEFEFVIVDMPVLHDSRVPILLTHQLDGLLVVVDTRRTRQEEIEKIFTQLNRNQILGFILNRSGESSYG